MFRHSARPIYVQWGPKKFTKDGRPRARQALWGIHRATFRERLPWPVVLIFASAVGYAIQSAYYSMTATTPTQRFLQRIRIVPHGVLGTQLHETGSLIMVADSPAYNTAIVDPAGLHHIHGVAAGAGGASGAIYKWLGLEGPFSDAVRLSMNVIGDAKLDWYRLPDRSLPQLATGEVVLTPPTPLPASASAKEVEEQKERERAAVAAAASHIASAKDSGGGGGSGNAAGAPAGGGGAISGGDAAAAKLEEDKIAERLRTRAVIHTVGPDFRAGTWTDREASLALARAYRNLLHEFVKSDCETLRVPPVSGGIFSGPLYNQIPVLTQEALAGGFDQLHNFDKETLLSSKKNIELCIFTVRDWDPFCNAFDYVSPPTKL